MQALDRDGGVQRRRSKLVQDCLGQCLRYPQVVALGIRVTFAARQQSLSDGLEEGEGGRHQRVEEEG